MQINLDRYLFTFSLLLMALLGYAQPQANFTVDKTEGCEPISVNFSDLSTSSSPITSWAWEINGAPFSSNSNPSYLISDAGLFSICLTIINQDGLSNQNCKNNYIEVFSKPEVDFTTNETEGCGPLEIIFTSTSTSSSGIIDSWVWDLGGPCGIIPGVKNEVVSCTYDAPGTYKTTLIVTDNNGCESSRTKNDNILVYENPDLQISSDYTFECVPPFSVNFSNDNPQPNTNYTWDFGNGQTSNGAFPPVVMYNGFGPYTVSVTATNQLTGCVKSLVLEEFIKVGNPIDFDFDSDAGCGDTNINFYDNSIDGATDILWDFGDGNTAIVSNPSHSYATTGCFDVVLTRTVNGCTNTAQQLLCITDPANLDVSIVNQNPLGCEIPHIAPFQSSSLVARSWLWDFGDGTTSTQQNPTHTYRRFGVYPVSLTITDPFGCERTISQDTVTVRATKVMLANLPLLGCLPLQYTLIDSVQSLTPIVSWNWTVEDENGSVIFTSSQAQPSAQITNAGCYNITLEVRNALGCTSTQTFANALCAGNSPTPNFSASPLQACASQTIYFENLSDASVDSWAWDFDGDGDFDSFESDPTYKYRDTGCFDVTLLVGSNGCTELITLPDYVCIVGAVAKFNVGRNCDTPFERSFVNKAIGADSIIWDFGVPGVNTDISTLANPSFTFPFKDTFNVMQVAIDFDSGCTDTLRKNIIITELNANFTLDTDMGCAPFELGLTNNTVDANRFFWSAVGGEISNARARTPVITFPTAGTYTTRLIALDVNNCRDTFIYDPIFANELALDFNSTQLGPCLPVEVEFVDNSTNLYATNVQWDWTFGDSTAVIGTASGQNVNYIFDQAGFIPTQLVVTDSWGCMDSIYVKNGINIDAPFASFAVDSFSCPGLELAFENQSGGTNLTYAWDFGDGATSTLEDPTHEYALGNYQASLTITTANCTHTSEQEIIVEDVTADFSIDPDYSPCPPSTVLFNDMSINAYNYEWEFGDNSGTSDQPSHIYTSRGYFDVTLIAIGGNADCRDTMVRDSIVAILGPSGDFSFEVDNTCLPAEVTLIGESERAYNYTWFLDDGNTVVSPNTTNDTIVYTYTELSTVGYIPKLMLASTCDTILVSPDTIFLNDLQVDFMASDTFLCDGENLVGFESLIESTEVNYQVDWNFPGGISSDNTQEDLAVEYNQPGIYDVTLAVDNGDCQDTLTKEAYIEVVEAIELLVEDQEICFGDTIQLNTTTNATAFIWTPLSNISDAEDANPFVFPESSTDYVVTANYKSCNPAIDTVSVVVNSLPQVIYPQERRYFPGQSIQLEIKPVDGVTDYEYNWFPTYGLSCANCPNPTASLDTNLVYTITITNRETGCMTSIEMSVRELTDCPEDLIYMPTAFSPNGDGNNDEFRMYSSNIEEIDYFQVYDRWGALLWETRDISEGWDGRVRGVLANPGVYVYSLVTPCPLNDRKVHKKGGITLMR